MQDNYLIMIYENSLILSLTISWLVRVRLKTEKAKEFFARYVMLSSFIPVINTLNSIQLLMLLILDVFYKEDLFLRIANRVEIKAKDK